MKKQTKLNERWIIFIKIMLDPWVLVLGASLVIIIHALQDTEGFNIHLYVILLIALLSSILGAFIIKKWIDIHNEDLVINRGKVSIKNLKLIYFNLLRTEKRIKACIRKLDKKDPAYDLTVTFFEEVIEKCHILQEECITSVSAWADVITDADAKTMLTQVFKLKDRKESLLREVHDLKKHFYESDAKDKVYDEQFERQLAQKEFDLNEVNNQLTEMENRINNSILSGMTGTSILKEANNDLRNFKTHEN